MKKFIMFLGLLLISLSCKKNEVSQIESDKTFYTTKARILEISCAGQVVQLIDNTENKGENFWGRSHLNGIQDSSNPKDTIYKNCVVLNPVPQNRIILGDTLEFTYSKVNGFKNVCVLGLPVDTLYQMEKLKSKI